MALITEQKKGIFKIDFSSIVQKSLIDSIKLLNPFAVCKNPILFVIECCLILMIILSIKPNIFGETALTKEINIAISLILLLTILFSNLAESLARNYTKAQADSLRIVHGDIEVKRVLENGLIEYVFTSQLNKNDIIKVQEGDFIPIDGEVIEGVASVDESAITGESSTVLKEPGTDISSSVTGGTRILTDWLLIKITSEQGKTYLDQMISIAEDVERHKTPNEISLNTLLIASTISFLLVVITIPVVMNYLSIKVETTFLIALLICLIPTTIGGLITPIRISGFDRINKLNILAMSEKSLEIAGDLNMLYLDKTGTITFGNRMATEFIPLGTHSLNDVAKAAYICSYYDQTPEGKSIIALARRYGIELDIKEIKGIPHEFTAHTRMSGIDLENGDILRKGASDAIKKYVLNKGGKVWQNTDQLVENIAIQGGTPLLISKNNEVIGLIHLKDIVKASIKDRFKELRNLGIKTIMCTGDNNLTAKVITREAGIDEYIAQAKPQDKIALIRDNQSKGMMVAMIGDGTNDAPALAQADIGLAMNTGTVAAKEASNLIDLDSNPTKIIDIIKIGRQLLATRGALTTFSITNDISKYIAILPSIFTLKELNILNIMHLQSSTSAVLSALTFNAIIIPLMTPIALNGISVKDQEPGVILLRNIVIFGLGGLILPFIGIKAIDFVLGRLL